MISLKSVVFQFKELVNEQIAERLDMMDQKIKSIEEAILKLSNGHYQIGEAIDGVMDQLDQLSIYEPETKDCQQEEDRQQERPNKRARFDAQVTCSFCRSHDHCSYNCYVFPSHVSRKRRANFLGLCEICLGVHPIPCLSKLPACSICRDNGHRSAICDQFRTIRHSQH